MVSKKDFPETLHVRAEFHGSRETDYLAYSTVEKTVDEDGPTVVAEYKLVRIRKFRKDTVVCG